MTEMLIWGLLALALLQVGLLLLLVFRPPSSLREGIRRAVEGDLREGRRETAEAARNLREEVLASLQRVGDLLANTQDKAARLQQDQFDRFSTQMRDAAEANARALEQIRATLDARVRELQAQNEAKLEEMRRTVDERLHGTLERRLGESFRLVSERLESVQRGLGEMQELAAGVGDLKRVLTNVKARGTWAEVQLGGILEQFLAPDQYARNVETKKGSGARVEFAVKLPGRSDDPSAVVWLPVDSKFPQEDYLRLQEAAEEGDSEGVQRASEALARTLKAEAQKIGEKYLDPPATTDFAILFLATEGLYAEVLRQPGLASELQHRHRILVAGPTTLAAILSSLRMGFQTLAIEKRASEVWEVLRAVKTEFSKFGEVLDQLKKQLQTVSNTVDKAQTRTRAMESKLRSVETLPESESARILALPSSDLPGERTLGEEEEEA